MIELVAQTRTTYDAVARDYADLLETELAGKPLLRSVLACFTELVQRSGGGAVADVGCGPGRVTRLLADFGLEAHGIDLSPGMVAEASRRHPDLRFDVGTMDALPVADDALGGVLLWYSLIHTPPDDRPMVFSELLRALRPGGHLQLAFQVGVDQRVDHQGVYGHPLALTVFRMDPSAVAAELADVGFEPVASTIAEPTDDRETTQQAFILVRKPRG